MAAEVWTIPAARMKAGAAHRAPMTDRRLAILTEARSITEPPMTGEHRGCLLMFPSVRGKALSDATMSKLMRENGVAAVPHGFRPSFRDWASECTNCPHAVMEAALAHQIRSAVERAYARSDFFERRRELMKAWTAFVTKGTDA